MNEDLVQASPVGPLNNQGEAAAPRRSWLWLLLIAVGLLFVFLGLIFVLGMAAQDVDVGLRCCSL